MTSEERGCFVYIVPPGHTEFVAAARFEIHEDRRGIATGRLVYGRRYLEHPACVPIDPVELTLRGGPFETVRLNGVFGALRDAGPDYWGRRLIERRSGRPVLHETDYLLESPDDRAGALGFGTGPEPPAPLRHFSRTLDLAKLQELADQVVEDERDRGVGDPDVGQVEDLLLLGTSMGGARPKAVVEDNGSLWIAKFNCADDRWNNARVEHAMLRLAAACGLGVADSRIVDVAGRDVLLVRRFDRQAASAGGYRRARMISALTLLQAEDSHRSRDLWSYPLLVEELRRISADPQGDARELFRRMCFNALISNADDHPRNHAAIAFDADWSLSPAYDLTPTSPVSKERRDLALTVGDEGRYANRRNILSQHRRFLLSTAEAAGIVDDMARTIDARWYEVARAVGVSERDCGRISGAFVYPGFRL